MKELRQLDVPSQVIFIGGPCKGVTGKLVAADALTGLIKVEKSGFTIEGPWESIEALDKDGATARPIRVVPLAIGDRVLLTGTQYKGTKGRIVDFKEEENDYYAVIRSDSGVMIGALLDDVVEIKE